MHFLQASSFVAGTASLALLKYLGYFSFAVGFCIFVALSKEVPRVYFPDMGGLFAKYPKYTLLYAISFGLSGFSNEPVKELLRVTSGRLAPAVKSTFELPERCILLMHHRRHHHPGLAVQEFHDFAEALGDTPYKVITARDWGTKTDSVSRLLKVVEAKIYGSIDVRGCQGTVDCGFKLVEPFLKTKGRFVLVVFPDKFGSQYLGDRRMFYREGAFAAAMALQIPVVDTISMYPSFAHQYHTFEMRRIAEPPKADPVTDAHSFREFKEKHKQDISDFTHGMQTLFFQDVEEFESKILSCDANAYLSETECKRCVYKNTETGAICT